MKPQLLEVKRDRFDLQNDQVYLLQGNWPKGYDLKAYLDTDPQYKGISSIKLLEHVAKLIEEKGYIVENIDATIIAQKPKMRPYIEEMEKNIATALHIDVSQVNVKATTEEGLGFTGTEQGISSQAICALTTIYESSVAVADSQAGCEGCAGCRKQS